MRRLGIATAIGALVGAMLWASFGAVARAGTALLRLWERWKTWQAASPDQRAQWGDDRHDVWPIDQGAS